MKFLLSLVAVVAITAVLGAEFNDDEVSLLQVEHSVTGAKPRTLARQLENLAGQQSKLEKYRGFEDVDKDLTKIWGYPTLTAAASKKHTAELLKKNTSMETGLLLLDTCPMDEIYVSMIAALTSLFVWCVSSCFVLSCFDWTGNNPMDTLRNKFHATRLIPWFYCGVIAAISIPLTMNRMWKEDVRFSHIVTACVPTLPTFVIAQFASLLIYDLIWVLGVFRSCAKKPLLLLHHAGYLSWSFATVYCQVGYLNLVCIVIGFEEVPELSASISYLKKDGPHGRWWLVFTIAFRMCCSAYAIGATMLFILLGYSGWELKAFLWFDICLWVGFVYQEWDALTELTPMVAETAEALKKIKAGIGSIFPQGCRVEAHSLSKKELNGLKGEVRGIQDDRVRIRFENGVQKLLKPVNLKHVHAGKNGRAEAEESAPEDYNHTSAAEGEN